MENRNIPKWILILAIVVFLALIGSVVYTISRYHQVVDLCNTLTEDKEQLAFELEQTRFESEYQAINAEFQQYEDQAMKLANDTIMAKYTAAKNKVEQLMKELKAERSRNDRNQAKIAELQKEISTLRGLLRHYIEQIDSLQKENTGLKAENAEIKNQNRTLTSQVEEVSQKAAHLSERMTLAEKLNVTGVSLTPLKKNGKTEKNVTKAHQLMVTFTIPQNNSTPVGNKTIYLRLTSPEGALLGGAGSFSFEGRSIPCSAHKTIEYAGEEISGIKIYIDANSTLNPGDYTVELFCDNYRLASRHFNLTK